MTALNEVIRAAGVVTAEDVNGINGIVQLSISREKLLSPSA
jgi:hypothetical protein